jgi:GNAT superfamily N-acetyltransferase
LSRPAPDGAGLLALRNQHRSDGDIVLLDPDAPELADGCYLRVFLDAEARPARLVMDALPGPDQVRPGPATEVWFVEVRESSAQPPAVNLVAFQGHGQPAGALLDEAAVSNLTISSSEQLGALRWWPATGEVDQVYVAPAWRRHGIATILVLTAAGLAIAREWPRPWSDGQRTELGEAFVHDSFFRNRAEALTHTLAPMTPPEASA